ncbi:RagB/SusD family nutrient uptake outer membrane protein [Ferruginibacter sp.]
MKKYMIFVFFTALGLGGCKKYLDQKPDQKLLLPNTITSLQALMDGESTMNLNNPGTGEVSADNYYLADATWSALTSAAQRNMYTWEADITVNEYPNHWSRLYDVVAAANVTLENIAKIQPLPNEVTDWNNVKGSALLYRAKSLLTAIGYWGNAYDPNTSGIDLGIPVRLSSDFAALSVRASVKEGYDQVLNDFKEAATLLPALPKHVMRPSQAAAFALLARTYLFMGVYDSAAVYADKCLAISSLLINYNTLSTTASNPVPLYNVEVLMHTLYPSPAILANSRARIDSNLYASYAASDLRKLVFFKSNGNGSYAFKGSYAQGNGMFNGVATDELYLTKAECLARGNKINEAMATINALLITRWKTGTFIPFSATNTADALQVILNERRKELIFRDIRWMDLKRLNKEVLFQQTVYRKLNGKEYTLLPNDKRYALPIPAAVIEMSGMPQNPR